MEHGITSPLSQGAAGRIEIQSVRKTYRDAAEGREVLALDGVTLNIEPREFLTLLGQRVRQIDLTQHPGGLSEARCRASAPEW